MTDRRVPRWQLTDDDAGRWVVTTLTSRYLLDLDTRQLMRQPGGGDRVRFGRGMSGGDRFGGESGPPAVALLRRDRDVVPLQSIGHCHVGQPLVLFLDLRGDGVVTMRRSTQVVAIDPGGDRPG